jgi:poly(beta-D-mannuronate) lyase
MMRCFFSLLLLSVLSSAAEIPVADVAALDQALSRIQPGDVVVLKEGEWKDAVLVVRAHGTAQQPVTVRAASAGKTVLTGASQLSISGEYVVVEGLHFRDPDSGVNEVIQLRTGSDELAEHCTLRNCAVTHSVPLPEGSMEAKWCSLYGTENVVEHCSFTGKKTAGCTLVVWLTAGGKARHQIQRCYFGPRQLLGKNGGETLRIGDSKTNLLEAGCRVEACLFEQCNGEVEIISNKSCGNLYVGNTFRECEGALTLRHGHRCTVTQNWFLGQGRARTGGVRIIGEGHEVMHNTFMNLTGEDYRCGLTFMLGNLKSNGYQQIKNVRVHHNTWAHCTHTVLIGMAHDKKCTLLPQSVTLEDNVMLSPQHTLIEKRSDTPDWVWQRNLLSAASIGLDLPAGDASACKPDAQGLMRMQLGSQVGAVMQQPPLQRKDVGTQGW